MTLNIVSPPTGAVVDKSPAALPEISKALVVRSVIPDPVAAWLSSSVLT